ncbi:unnamed protein product [Rotaria sp. Silwood2]|nr:unnamed protein product [Rotaria sp. Silwood2]CAF2599342.1 unnamed protein product [Rotaria sp. Silwood2]CAF3879920.1 unnamed protein product [Rotaria sp. Silwood2]CAF4322782.1 unnamed protein product [Rotaria sp. Silwood2]
MTNNQKDRICNDEKLQEAINQLEVNTNQNANINNSLKRSATNEHPRYSDDEELNNNIYTSEWNIISNRKQKKKLNDTNDQFALNYVANYQYPLFKLECEPNNRTNIEEHKERSIKCHHYGVEHLSTDCKCPLLDDYRRQIICELRKRPEKRPQRIQLFIPSEYRNQNDKTMYHHHHQQQYYCRNDHNQWPLLTTSTTTNTTTNQNMNEIIKSFNDELVELKKTYMEDQQRNKEKYKEHMDSINQTWPIIPHVVNTG